jgi:hypothetical protein
VLPPARLLPLSLTGKIEEDGHKIKTLKERMREQKREIKQIG